MFKDLQTALMTRYNSSAAATLRTLTQGMWESEAPSEIVLDTQSSSELEYSTLPFIVFEGIGTSLEQNFCSNFFNTLIQFSIIGDGNNKSSLSVLNAGDEFLRVFGDQLLDMDNYDMIRNDTVGQRKFKDENKFFNLVYELEFIVEKTR